MDANLNGQPLPGLPHGPPVNKEVVDLLGAMQQAAKRGELQGVAMVCILGPHSVQLKHAGGFLFEVNMGAELLKQAVIDHLKSKKPSGLMRV